MSFRDSLNTQVRDEMLIAKFAAALTHVAVKEPMNFVDILAALIGNTAALIIAHTPENERRDVAKIAANTLMRQVW